MSDNADALLSVANRYPLLNAQQEIELGRLIRAWQDWEGGPDAAPKAVQRRGRRALDRFVTCNLRLAHYIARRFRGRGVPLEDLMQQATEGLITAYKRFKPSYGYRSSTYATWYAMQACQNAVAQQGGGLRLPTAVHEQLRKVSRITAELTAELGRSPIEAEIEDAAGLPPGRLAGLQANARLGDCCSLDALVKEDSAASLMDWLADPVNPTNDLERVDQQRLARRLVEQGLLPLQPHETYLLQCRYLSPDPPSLARLAGQLNMSRETLRRAERRALAALRRSMRQQMAA